MVSDLINAALKDTKIPYYYFERPTNVFPCIVVQYNEYFGYGGDNKEEAAKYDIYLNLVTKDDIIKNTQKIKEVMESHGFSKVSINTPEKFDGTDYFQIVFNYLIMEAN